MSDGIPYNLRPDVNKKLARSADLARLIDELVTLGIISPPGKPPDVHQGSGSDDRPWSRWGLFKVFASTRDTPKWRWSYELMEYAPRADFTPWDVAPVTSEYTDGIILGFNTNEINNTDDAQGIQSKVNLARNGITGIEAIPNGHVVMGLLYGQGTSGGGTHTFVYFSEDNPPIIDCEEEGS